MESNWPVIYHTEHPRPGPGPFQSHVERDGAAALEWNARGTHFTRTKSGCVGVNLDAPQRQEVGRLDPQGRSDFMYKAVLGKALLAGPKLFRPTAAACEPLEQVELGVPIEDYRPPFPTCVVEFPLYYAAGRLIPAAVPGSEFVRPGFAVAHHENDVLVVALGYTPVVGQAGYLAVYMGFAVGTIEDTLQLYKFIPSNTVQRISGLRTEAAPPE